MRFDIISLFPEFVANLAAHGVVGRAGERGLIDIHGWNSRDHAEGNCRRVDDPVRAARIRARGGFRCGHHPG